MEKSSTVWQRFWDSQEHWRLLLLAALLAGLLTRVVFLNHDSLWLDEALSLRVAQAGLAELWQGPSTAPDHPPFYFWVLGLWQRLGHGEGHLRLISVVAGVAAVPLAFGLARVLFTAPVGITAAWLTALSPLLIWYSQEVRSYSLLVFFGMGATYALARLWLDQRGVLVRSMWWALYIIFVASALYTHYMAVLLFTIQALLFTGLVAQRRIQMRSIWPWIAALIVTLMAYSPWLSSPAARGFAARLGENSLYPAQLLSATFDLEPFQVQLLLGIGMPIVFLATLGLTYLVFRNDHLFWEDFRRNQWFQTALIAMYAGALVISVIPRAYTVKRQLLVLTPYLLLVFAWFWTWTRQMSKVLIVVLTISTIASATILAVPKDQWRESVSYMHEHADSDDLVLLWPGYLEVPFEYYNHGQVTRNNTYSLGITSIPELFDQYGRIWHVTHTIDTVDTAGQVQAWLDDNARLIDEKSFYRIEMRLYSRLD